MSGFTDIHSHFIYGVDDGARTKEEMERMLDKAHADKIGRLIATPHVTPALKPFDWQPFNERLEEAKAYCAARGYEISIYPGAEVMYTPALQGYMAEHALPTLANTDSVLIEFVPDIEYWELEAAIDLLEREGYRPILAHIERYDCLKKRNSAQRLKDAHDVRFQVNANTLFAENGFFERKRIESWFNQEIVDFVSSDAHGCRRRTFRMRAAYEELDWKYARGYAAELTGLQGKEKP